MLRRDGIIIIDAYVSISSLRHLSGKMFAMIRTDNISQSITIMSELA